jgi:hypothetical protein
MNNTVKEAKNSYQQVRDLSKTRGYINTPIDVKVSLKNLDCVSRCIWHTVFDMGYFYNGAATIALQDLADDLAISRSSLEMKLKRLIETGYIHKQNNYNPDKQQYMASTYYAMLPSAELERISKLPTRRECFDTAGRFITEGLEKQPHIEAPINELITKVTREQANETASTIREVQSKIDAIEKTATTGLASKVDLLALKCKLKSLSEKNLVENISTPTLNQKVGSPNGCEIYNNNEILGIIKNNNMQNIEDKAITSCSFASPRYKNDPVRIPVKITDKIHRAVYQAKSIAMPDQVIIEAEFAVSRCFTGVSVEHAANVFCKLLREGRWTTPIPMRRQAQDFSEKPIKMQILGISG